MLKVICVRQWYNFSESDTHTIFISRGMGGNYNNNNYYRISISEPGLGIAKTYDNVTTTCNARTQRVDF